MADNSTNQHPTPTVSEIPSTTRTGLLTTTLFGYRKR